MKKNKEKFDYDKFEAEAIKQLYSGKPLVGKEGIFTPLIKRFIEASLEGEMLDFMEYNEGDNRRNGKSSKKVRTSLGSIDIETPRDRQSEFTPQILPKRKRVLNDELSQKILSMYGLGMSYSAIRDHIREIYTLDISESTISRVTDQVNEQVEAWRKRPLESTYLIVWMDAIYFKVIEDKRVVNKAVYLIIGVSTEGYKDLLGMYIGSAESANFWLDVLTDLKNRGIEDILICCIDNLKGFSKAIKASFPQTDVQLCIVHQIRSSLRYVSCKRKKTIMPYLRDIYKANDIQSAQKALNILHEKWADQYKHMVDSWVNNFEFLSTCFKYPPEIRRLIYTTNPIESFNSILRKVTKTKRVFPNDNAILKVLFLIQKKFTNKHWSRKIHRWKLIEQQFYIKFKDRFK